MKENPFGVSSLIFPDPRSHWGPDGLIAIGGRMDAATLFSAYSSGVFPWPQPDLPLLWFCPERRGVLFFSKFHVSKSLEKFYRKNTEYKFTLNQAFSQVVEECRLLNRPGQEGTWILPEMVNAYSELQKKGYALSLECWKKNELIAGIYGVLVNAYFSGESMFFKQTNTSKLCLWRLVEYLESNGLKFMDTQMVTPLLAGFGAEYISKEKFLDLI